MRIRGTCTIAGCTSPHEARGWCEKHWKRWRKHGDPLKVASNGQVQGEHPAYSTVHRRIRRVRGRASAHRCIDCGRAAAEWSYDGTDPDELIGQDSGRTMPYSTDPARYQPRCKSCHWAFDHRPRTAA